MIEVNLFDDNFAHTKDIVGVLTSTYVYPPKNIRWVERQMEFDGITVFSDWKIFDPIVDEVKSEKKVAWLIEPPALHPLVYSDVIKVEDKFDHILTFDERLLNRSDKYVKYIMGQSRVEDEHAGLHPKTRGISMVSSGKAMTDGHRYRADIINHLNANHVNFDLWGNAYRRFESKLEPLRDYAFSVCIMNSRLNHYFTEILVDCFRLGTIPIFWGCPNIGDYFDVRGMELFETPDDLMNVIKNLKPYDEYIEYAKINFELCKKYTHTDDHIAEILSKL